MVDETTVVADIVRGKSFLTNTVHKDIFNSQIGINKKECDDKSKSLLFIIRALEFRIEQNKIDSITNKLWKCLIKIIGNYIPPANSKFYYTLNPVDIIPSESTILTWDYIEAPIGSNPIIPFGFNINPLYGFMAELITEPLKTEWQDIVISFNGGEIGSPTDLFNAPTVLSTLRVYRTEYLTQFDNPIEFIV